MYCKLLLYNSFSTRMYCTLLYLNCIWILNTLKQESKVFDMPCTIKPEGYLKKTYCLGGGNWLLPGATGRGNKQEPEWDSAFEMLKQNQNYALTRPHAHKPRRERESREWRDRKTDSSLWNGFNDLTHLRSNWAVWVLEVIWLRHSSLTFKNI